MPDPQFRQQFRPLDPDAVAEFVAEQPRLLVIEVTAVEADDDTRYGVRLLDPVAAKELDTHTGVAASSAAGLLTAVAWGFQAVAAVAPDAQIAVRGPEELCARLGVQELIDAGAVNALALGRDAQA